MKAGTIAVALLLCLALVGLQAANWARYEQLMRGALLLSDFTGTVENNNGGIEMSFEAANPSVSVIVMDFEGARGGK
jgi:uncharacterized membrane protein